MDHAQPAGKRNAMSPTLHLEMEEILFGLETDENTKVVVLTGSGNSWSAGMDLKQYFRETDQNPAARFRAATGIADGPQNCSTGRVDRALPW